MPVKRLINGTTIAQTKRRTVSYYHLELPCHTVILAERMPVESYLDAGDRANFNSDGATTRLFPNFAERLDVARNWEARAVAPLVLTGPKLDIIRRMVAAKERRSAVAPDVAQTGNA